MLLHRQRRPTTLKQSTMYRAKCRLTVLVILTAAFVSPAAMAEPVDLEKLTANPLDYLGKRVEIAAYCVKGGVKGDGLGYECTTEGGVYVDAGDVEPAAAKEKVDESCKGEGRDPACRATIRFVPHSFTTSSVIEPDKIITIFTTEKAELSF